MHIIYHERWRCKKIRPPASVIHGFIGRTRDRLSAPKTYSWMQSYDDVSVDGLIKYLESVIDSTPDEAVAPDADPPTPLGDAQPFEYSADLPVGDADQLARPRSHARPIGHIN